MAAASLACTVAFLTAYTPTAPTNGGRVSARPQRTHPIQLFDATPFMPYIAGAMGLGGILYLAGENGEDGSVPMPPPLSTPWAMAALSNDEFSGAWKSAVRDLGASAVAAATLPTGEASLQSRIASVQALTRQRHELADCLAVAVQVQLGLARLSLLSTAESIAPGATLPDGACDLVRVSQQFPGQSASQVRSFVLDSAPSNDARVHGRFDRLQAAQLYMGCAQFGYFVGELYIGQAVGRARVRAMGVVDGAARSAAAAASHPEAPKARRARLLSLRLHRGVLSPVACAPVTDVRSPLAPSRVCARARIWTLRRF